MQCEIDDADWTKNNPYADFSVFAFFPWLIIELSSLIIPQQNFIVSNDLICSTSVAFESYFLWLLIIRIPFVSYIETLTFLNYKISKNKGQINENLWHVKNWHFNINNVCIQVKPQCYNEDNVLRQKDVGVVSLRMENTSFVFDLDLLYHLREILIDKK